MWECGRKVGERFENFRVVVLLMEEVARDNGGLDSYAEYDFHRARLPLGIHLGGGVCEWWVPMARVCGRLISNPYRRGVADVGRRASGSPSG